MPVSPRTSVARAMPRTWIAAVVVLVALTWGCGKSAKPTTATDSAKQRVVDVVNATAAKVAPDLPRAEDKGGAPSTGCEKTGGAPDGTAIASFRYVIDLPNDTDATAMLTATSSFWKQRGYKVDDKELQTPRTPIVYASFGDGYTLSFQIVTYTHKGYLGGGTPCLAPSKSSKD